MKAVSFEHYSFAYPGTSVRVLDDVSVEFEEGTFNVICGLTGSGKTTLLRAIKPELAPVGDYSGTRKVFGRPIEEFSPQESAARIGFVMQNPENQLVMDTVWHELAFGLENIGTPTQIMRRRVAETAHFFGIGDWFDKKTSELSGGQKQLLNLASVITMQPKVLVLDEPTAQLDPITAKDFLQMLQRVNVELGITVIVSEHRLEEVFPMADRVFYVEGGNISFADEPGRFITKLIYDNNPFFDALPSATKVAFVLGERKTFPMLVKDGRAWIERTSYAEHARKNDTPEAQALRDAAAEVAASAARTAAEDSSHALITAKEVWFRYSKETNFVLQGTTFNVNPAQIHAIVGGNGAGKSTLMYTLAGVRKPTQGGVKTKKGVRVAVMAQDARTLFMCDTIREDLCEWKDRFGYGDAEIDAILAKLHLTHLADRHPYDLSGGETQKAALAKLLLMKPDVMLLDEPVKGVDIVAKQDIAKILIGLKKEGKAIVMVSHDLDFVAQTADICSMMFGGQITCSDTGKNFFEGNMFFTTGVNRVTRSLLPGCVTLEDVVEYVIR